MLVLKAFHIIAMVAWFAGLFYLPRLFVYHADAEDTISIQRFKLMERRLYYGITWPAALFTTAFGIGMVAYLPAYYLKAGWMHMKLLFVFMLWGYHLSCGYYLRRFSSDNNQKGARFYRIYNEVPSFLLISIVLIVVIRPQLTWMN